MGEILGWDQNDLGCCDVCDVCCLGFWEETREMCCRMLFGEFLNP